MGLLQAMLNYETNDPLILSCVLTNISTLFPFATRREQFLPRVFYKVSKKHHQQIKWCWRTSIRCIVYYFVKIFQEL